MRDYRRAGHALLLGVLLPLAILWMHPTAHDLTADSGSRLATVNHVVHGIAIAAQPLVLLGLVGLTQLLECSATATLALLVYAMGVMATVVAAVMSGFVASDVIVEFRAADAAATGLLQSHLAYTHYLNQAFAKVAVVAQGVSLILWAIALRASGRLHPLTPVVGGVVGAMLALGVVQGTLALDVRGILLATGLQAVWLVFVALQLRRLAPAARPEAAARTN